jgi:hypothetical protein
MPLGFMLPFNPELRYKKLIFDLSRLISHFKFYTSYCNECYVINFGYLLDLYVLNNVLHGSPGSQVPEVIVAHGITS